MTRSPMASPRLELFSTVKVDIVVEATLTEPVAVREFTNTSPSASTRNLTLPPTASPRRFESAVAEIGLTRRLEFVTFEPATSTSQAGENTWAIVGTLVISSLPAIVLVAAVEVAVMYEAVNWSPIT